MKDELNANVLQLIQLEKKIVSLIFVLCDRQLFFISVLLNKPMFVITF